jgi:hypothetical protein
MNNLELMTEPYETIMEKVLRQTFSIEDQEKKKKKKRKTRELKVDAKNKN